MSFRLIARNTSNTAVMELKNVEKCVIHTGNILSINDITRKSTQNSTEELVEAINITVKEYQNGKIAPVQNGKLLIHRFSDDLKVKMEEQVLSDLKIGLKIFLNKDSKLLIQEAVDEGLAALQVPSIQNVVLQYKNDKITETIDDLSNLKNLWTVLEEYVKNEKIGQIGLADVEEATFRSVFEWATIKPTIVQINLASCCVVPPSLQQFCKDNDVQLLTHSDPSEILPKTTIEESLATSLPVSLSIRWISRFLIHIKCRGVLCSKGYLIGLGEE